MGDPTDNYDNYDEDNNDNVDINDTQVTMKECIGDGRKRVVMAKDD
jgi:hypothetical protein